MGLRAQMKYHKVSMITLLLGLILIIFIAFFSPVKAATGVNEEINFQGRLLNSQGAVVPDGYYNIEFKIYQDGDGQSAGDTTGSPSGTLKWTEDYLNNDGNGVQVKNGFLSVQLGSITPFGSNIDWNQDTLWLSMNIGGTGTSCTPFSSCSPDGEMLPMKRLTSTPYAVNSKLLGGLSSAQYIQLAQGLQTDASSNNSLYINKTGSGNIVDLQSSGVESFAVTNSGNVTFGANANHSISISDAAAGAAGKSLTLSAGNAGSGGSAAAGGALTLNGGNAGGTGDADGGDVTITGGSGVGTGTRGLVIINAATFSTSISDPNCFTGGALVTSSCTIATSTINNKSGAVVGFNQPGQVATLPDPDNTTAGRVFYIAAAPGSSNFTLSVNGGGTGNEVAMRENTTATMVWNGSAWGAAGASSSTDLQAAYDNTLQSAGNAELVISHTPYTNGLTIRDSSVNPVNGPLVSIQTNSAATLFSTNSNVTEYASDAGAEVEGATSSTFPASTWANIGSASVSRYTTVGDYIATGKGSVSIATTAAAGDGVKNTLDAALTANQHYNVSFSARLVSGTFNDLAIYYSADGSAQSVACNTSQTIITSGWTKINCSFTASSSGITTSNAILVKQTAATARTFYIDNLSVTIAADYNYATDGGVDDNSGFSTNWTSVSGATVTRSTSIGNDASDSAQVVTTGSGQGVRNILSVAPLKNSLYRVTAYVASTTSGFNNFTVRYTPDGGTSMISCVDYSTQTISSSTSSFTKVTCYIETDGTTVSSPYIYFTQTDSTGRTFYVDTFSLTLATDTTPNVQIGGGAFGGPTTLFTLDSSASAPIASDNEALLGSMYYDTTLGKIQCYEASGWGSCGSSPNTIVTISPEYTNAVLHGTGVGTMTSDFCSDVLHINDGTSSQPTICGSNETYNFYKWTSPQATAQTYSIYVSYQLPDTFKAFSSTQTSLMGRTDSSDSTVEYDVYRENSVTGLTQCGSTVSVSNGSVSSWQVGTADGAADPSTCGFSPGDSIVFKIDVIASQNADAYVSNLNFIFSNN